MVLKCSPLSQLCYPSKKKTFRPGFCAVLYEEKWQEFQKDFKPKLILTKCEIKRKWRTKMFSSVNINMSNESSWSWWQIFSVKVWLYRAPRGKTITVIN